MSRFKTKEFKKLEHYWYEILKENGFSDIENTQISYRPLHAWDSYRFHAKLLPVAFEAKRKYYELAQSFLESYTFDSPWDQDVWRLHAHGASVREIALIMNTNASRIHLDVTRLKAAMQSQKGDYDNEA